MRKSVLLLTTLAVSIAFVGPQTSFGQSAKGKPRAKVEFYSSVENAVAGRPFDVAFHFKIDEGWHIYWQNSGDSGQPPRVSWKLPAGVTAGELQFPVPKRHKDPGGIITNVHEGEPTLLVSITPAGSADASQILIEAELKYLVCREICLQESADLKLKLPVTTSGEPRPANEKLFENARKRLPKPSSNYLTIKAATEPSQLPPSKKFQFAVTVDIKSGFHLQSHEPTAPTLVGCDLFVRRVDGIFWDQPVFPPAMFHEDASGKSSEYSGVITIGVPGEVDAEAKGALNLGGVLVFQACDTAGKCFPPEAVSFAHPVKLTVASLEVAPGSDARADAAPLQTQSQSGAVPSPSQPPPPAATDPIPAAAITSQADVPSGLPTTFLGVLAFAFLGGLILNVMPCVLPVISIKILSFVQQAKESRRRVIGLGLTFSAGMILSFWALALVIFLLRTWGQQMGWGFQFQSPRFVIAMMSIMFVFGLSLLGVFLITLPGAAVNHLSAAEEREGYLGAFLKGVLGTILATPCTAPFLGPALGIAFRSTNAELFLIFTAVGLGMASPFIVLSTFPAWVRFLPRPGTWMEHFKHVMGFVLMGTVVFLMMTLGHQIGVEGLAYTSGFLVVLAFACWLLGTQTVLTRLRRRLTIWVAAVGLTVFGWWACFERSVTIEDHIRAVLASRDCPCASDVPVIQCSSWEQHIPWQTWSKGRAEHLASLGYTVYVDYTATWCATCLANKKATLESDTVRAFMRDNCVIPLKADFTLEDPAILEDLQRFGRSGVPLNVIYPAGDPDRPIVMPEQLVGRSALVIEKLTDAGTSKLCSCAGHEGRNAAESSETDEVAGAVVAAAR